MNKYQKTRSRAIKRIMRAVNQEGGSYSYIQTKRNIRKLSRMISRVWTIVKHATYPVCNELRGLSAHTYIIDETPIVSKPAQWPKDNPFVTRHMGKFNVKEEDHEAD